MFTYYCEKCGKKCEAKYKSKIKRFCSHKCANLARWENTPKSEVVIYCQQCGTPFYVKKGDHRLKNNTVKFCSRKCSGEYNKNGSYKECPVCKKIFYTTRRICCSVDCGRIYRSENWKHKPYMENGYIVEYKKGYNKKGNIKQHRRIMEEYLERKLTADEVVHHINGDKTDNRIENLQVLKRGEHNRLHRKAEKAAGKHLFGGYNNN